MTQEALAPPASAESLSVPRVAPEDRVPLGQKVAYGLGTTNDMWGNWLYPGLVWPVFNIFLFVSPALVSTALMINRLIDAVSDPVFGWLSDNTRTRWGRRRPYILVGSILSGLCLPFLFWVGPGWSQNAYFWFMIILSDIYILVGSILSGLCLPLLFWVGPGWSQNAYFWFMIISSGIYITIVSSFNMPYQSLGAELTPDYNERTSVFSFKSGIQKLPEVAMFFAAAFTTLSIFNDPATGKPNILRGAQVYCSILGVIMIGVGILVAVVVKERYYHKVIQQKQPKIKIAETIYKTLRCRPFRAQLLMALAYGMGTSMVGTLGYYATVYYVCRGDVSLGSKWNFGMGLSNMALGFLGIPVFAFIARRLGKRIAMMWVQVSAVLVFVGTWWFYDPEHPLLQLFASGLIAFTGAGFWMLYGSIGADIIDYDELETGKRREGAFAACGSWIMKVGLALGIGVSGFVLSATGFDASRTGPQTEHTLTMIRLFLAVIPVIGLLLALLALSLFGLTPEKMTEIRNELEARRGRV